MSSQELPSFFVSAKSSFVQRKNIRSSSFTDCKHWFVNYFVAFQRLVYLRVEIDHHVSTLIKELLRRHLPHKSHLQIRSVEAIKNQIKSLPACYDCRQRHKSSFLASSPWGLSAARVRYSTPLPARGKRVNKDEKMSCLLIWGQTLRIIGQSKQSLLSVEDSHEDSICRSPQTPQSDSRWTLLAFQPDSSGPQRWSSTAPSSVTRWRTWTTCGTWAGPARSSSLVCPGAPSWWTLGSASCQRPRGRCTGSWSLLGSCSQPPSPPRCSLGPQGRQRRRYRCRCGRWGLRCCAGHHPERND